MSTRRLICKHFDPKVNSGQAHLSVEVEGGPYCEVLCELRKENPAQCEAHSVDDTNRIVL